MKKHVCLEDFDRFGASVILAKMYNCQNYDDLLYELACLVHSDEVLNKLSKFEKTVSVYDCEGRFSLIGMNRISRNTDELFFTTE